MRGASGSVHCPFRNLKFYLASPVGCIIEMLKETKLSSASKIYEITELCSLQYTRIVLKIQGLMVRWFEFTRCTRARTHRVNLEVPALFAFKDSHEGAKNASVLVLKYARCTVSVRLPFFLLFLFVCVWCSFALIDCLHQSDYSVRLIVHRVRGTVPTVLAPKLPVGTIFVFFNR